MRVGVCVLGDERWRGVRLGGQWRRELGITFFFLIRVQRLGGHLALNKLGVCCTPGRSNVYRPALTREDAVDVEWQSLQGFLTTVSSVTA